MYRSRMAYLVLVRHGQSLWNLENRFTGWVDVPLTPLGEEEARRAGKLIADSDLLAGRTFAVAYTSVLSRAERSLDIILEALGQNPPIIRDAALNERNYGDLNGLNKAETAEKYGERLVLAWRRSYDTPPPNGESLKHTAARALPFFDRAIMGDLTRGKDVLVVAHGNSNRSIAMRLDGLTPEQVVHLEHGTGVPVVYDLDAAGGVLSRTVLGED